jgi:hypothetical protein
MWRTLSWACTGRPPAAPRVKEGLAGLLPIQAAPVPARQPEDLNTARHVGGDGFPPATVSSS